MNRGSNHSGGLVVLSAALMLCGCAGTDFGSGWFSKPLDLLGSKNGYTYSALDQEKQQRPITANDLVDANGACPRSAPAAQAQSAPVNSAESGAVSPDAASFPCSAEWPSA